MELDQFHHKAIVRTGDASFLLDKQLSLLVIIPQLEYDICDDHRDRARDTLDAVDEYVMLILLGILYEIDGSVEEALDVLILGVFEEEGEVVDALVLEPVLAVVSSAVDDWLYPVPLEGLEWFGYLLARDEDALHYLAALVLEFLHLKFVPSSGSDIKLYFPVLLLLLDLVVGDLLEWLEAQF